ncbi:hypothetical protein ACU4GI_16110 [Cupriavidus basilensis]|uniref:hypothetical protein n=1 Tax=Cupriavidus TaxID=106589 RepID=UPI00044CBEBC|nr:MULTISPECIES: hypothetical protein [Cupriavidus]KDP85926.1 hypothetical protein CF70_011190 [Cupriavidus sp. SK-3]MDF3884064.1 hypothetical protein [Cupriavidus basilensis]
MSANRAARPALFLRATLLAASLATCAALLPVTAHGQAPLRVIPADAAKARLVLAAPSPGAPQSATLDGKTVGVAPGLRLFGTDNQLLPIAAVAGQKLPVRFKLDLYGQLLTAWVLSEQEQKTAQ